ncbi:SLATT domain-containing protein [Desulfococcaceae bacterium HSG7]|nr:SLATT domain-containing protein [Desulfococcaceae bacterium HSG7]
MTFDSTVDSVTSETEIKIDTYEPSSLINFPNGNTAKLIKVPLNATPDDFLERLGLSPPKALIIIAGGTKDFDEKLKSRMYQFFSRGIARAASDIEAMIIDGGTHAGWMAVMGESVAGRGHKTPLIGISPAGRVTYPESSETQSDQNKVPLDPNHSHFISVDTSDWGGEVNMMFRFAEHLKGSNDIPVMTVLVNGGKFSRAEVLHSVRLGSPIIIFKGSGRLADEIAKLHEEMPDFIENPEMAEIVQEGDIRLFSVESSINALERMIARQVRRDSMLKLAWNQFGVYDLNAIRHQRQFFRIQNAIIWLGVTGTALALIQSWIRCSNIFTITYPKVVMYYLVTATPIMVTILVAAANEFKSGNKWVLLRGSAETLKSEIFRCRILNKNHNIRQSSDATETGLAKKLEQMSNRLVQTEINLSALRPYKGPLPPMYATGPGDDGFSALSPEKYLTSRLEDQLSFYISKTAKLEKRSRLLGWLVFIMGGLGTMLAAFNMGMWVALTNSMGAAFGIHMKYEMLQESLTKYNQTAVALTNVRNWWLSLSVTEQAEKSNITILVENTEGILRSEFSSWVQEMQDTIAELQKEEAEEENDDKEETGKKNDGKEKTGKKNDAKIEIGEKNDDKIEIGAQLKEEYKPF